MLRIGISACFFHPDPKRPIFKGKTLLYLEQSLAHWVLSKGALAYLIPAPATTFVEDLDGLILQGGSDVSPRSYGEKPLKPEWAGDYVRDCYEIALVKEFLAQKKPILGVCRGLQLINVALGGTLYQDIEAQVPGAVSHRDWDIYDENYHEIEIDSQSGLAQLYGNSDENTIANSVHHQAIKDLGQNLVVEAKCPHDGIIEAVRLKSQDQYLFAIQWHPEFHDLKKNPKLLDNAPILEEFLKNAKR